jgi:taurine dioxygenase
MTGTLRINPISPSLGARVEGVDLSSTLAEDTIAEIRRALLKHEVLFFEDQDITPEQQRNFAARFGKLHIHPIRPSVPGVPEVLVMGDQPGSGSDNAIWRSDVTFIETPPMGSLLYACDVPREGGDTLWSSMRATYSALSQPFQKFLSGLDAEHDFARSYPADRFGHFAAGMERFAWTRNEHPPVRHPVVRTHPESGRDGLFVNSGFTSRILGLNENESVKLLELLREHIQRPEFLVRWKWKPGSLAFWDNRVTQHYTVNDYLPHKRILRRVTILGDKPFNRSRLPRGIAAE